MGDAMQAGTRLTIARSGIFIFLIGLGLRILLQANQAETPVAVAAAVGNVSAASVSADQAAQASMAVTFVSLEWLSQCASTPEQLGLYARGDAPCQPSRSASLAWLQSQLSSTGMLASGEYLAKAADPNNRACVAQILAGTMGQPAGWVCSDQNGLYRTDPAGQASGQRMRLWIQ